MSIAVVLFVTASGCLRRRGKGQQHICMVLQIPHIDWRCGSNDTTACNFIFGFDPIPGGNGLLSFATGA